MLGAREHPVTRARRAMRALEFRRAQNSFSIYAGLHIPADVEADDDEGLEELLGLEKLPMAARYIAALHHQVIIEKLEALERGYVIENGKRRPFRRLMIFAPPGSAKSTYASVLYPAWYMGKHPRHCVIQGSYNDKLASRFGRRARNAFASDVHQSVFGVGLAKGSRAQAEWETELGGEYFSFGMNAGVTGRRADGVVLDDVVRGRKDADSKTVRDTTWETYKADVRTRMKPNAWIVYIATRWHEDDPAGRILPPEALGKSGFFTAKDGEEWYVLSFDAVIESEADARDDILRRKVGEILWPEWFTEQMLLQEKRTQGRRNWAALYKQRPSPDEGGILQRKYWRKWPGAKPPKCEYVVSVYDTAFEEGEENDYTARTTWGVFWFEEPPPAGVHVDAKHRDKPVGGRHCCVLLEWYEDRVEFPELRRLAREHYKTFKPDRVLIEKKASGHSLLQELRRGKTRVPVAPLAADRSKLARAHAASVVLEDGCVWYMDRKWSEQVIDRCATATFVKGSPGNDTADTCVYAWLFLRKTFHLDLKSENHTDEDDEDNDYDRQTNRARVFG